MFQPLSSAIYSTVGVWRSNHTSRPTESDWLGWSSWFLCLWSLALKVSVSLEGYSRVLYKHKGPNGNLGGLGMDRLWMIPPKAARSWPDREDGGACFGKWELTASCGVRRLCGEDERLGQCESQPWALWVLTVHLALTTDWPFVCHSGTAANQDSQVGPAQVREGYGEAPPPVVLVLLPCHECVFLILLCGALTQKQRTCSRSAAWHVLTWAGLVTGCGGASCLCFLCSGCLLCEDILSRLCCCIYRGADLFSLSVWGTDDLQLLGRRVWAFISWRCHPRHVPLQLCVVVQGKPVLISPFCCGYLGCGLRRTDVHPQNLESVWSVPSETF